MKNDRSQIGGRVILSFAVLSAVGLGALALQGVVSPAYAAKTEKPALPKQANDGMTIFRGDPKASSGITVNGWGSGTATEDDKVHMSGTISYKIATQGYYQGASLNVATPFDLAPYLANKNTCLQFAVRLPDESASTGNSAGGPGLGTPPGGGGPPGGFGGFGGGGGGYTPPGGGGRGGRGGFGGGGQGGPPGGYSPPGGGGVRGGANSAPQRNRTLTTLRIALIPAGEGKSVEFLLPLSYGKDNDIGWKQLSIPIPAIVGVNANNAKFKEIRIFGDTPGTVWIGQIRVVTESAPLTLESISDKPALQRNAKYTLNAKGSAGSLPLKYTWDFDDSDGLQEEAVGQVIQHNFQKSGDFIVTVTVSDVYGLRTPVSKKFKVFVTR